MGTPVSPCDLVAKSDWAAFLDRGERAYATEVPRLDARWGAIYNCDIVVHGLLTRASFGYSIDDFDFDAAWRSYKPLDISLDADERHDITHRQALSGIGERAFIASGLIGYRALAEIGDVTVSVASSSGTPSQIAGSLQVLALQASPDMLGHPIDLPRACPAATDPRVTDVIGAVAQARGDEGKTVHACDYASEQGSVAIVLRGLSPGVFRTEYETGRDGGLEVLDPPPGLFEDWTGPSRDHDYQVFVLDPRHEVEVQVDVTPRPNDRHPLPGATPKRVLALVDRYLDDYTRLRP